MKAILVPTDFSEASEPAIAYAIELAARVGATVTLLHAFPLKVFPMLDGVLLPPPEDLTDMVVRGGEQIEALRARYEHGSIVLSTKVVPGPAADAIVRIAQDEHFDLIVMGTHGRSGLKQLVLGSVAEHVVRTSTTPVLTIRAPHAEKSAAESATHP